jgi:hypothetical protein
VVVFDNDQILSSFQASSHPRAIRATAIEALTLGGYPHAAARQLRASFHSKDETARVGPQYWR